MKLQSRILGANRIFGRRAPVGATDVDVSDIPFTNMQSLAAELQQSAQQGQFEYPRNWVLVAKTAAALLVVLSVAHAGLVLMQMAREGDNQLATLLNWTTLGVVLSVAVSGVVGGFLANLFPTLHVTPEGLGISELTGKRYIPWKQISVLRVMELRSQGRYVVLVPFTGSTKPATPAPMLRWLPTLLGASGWGGRGVMLTSDIKDFDRLMQLIVSYMVGATGQNPNLVPFEAYVDEDAVMPIAQLLLDPETEIVRIASNPVSKVELYGISSETTDPPIAWKSVLLKQVPIALVPALLLVMDVLMRHNERPFVWQHALWTVMLVGFGIAELPFVAMLVRAVGDLMVGSGQFNRTVRAYLELQTPRAILLMVGAGLLGIGLPAIFTQGLWFAGIVLTTLLTVRYVQRVYYMPITHTLLAALGTFIFQFSLLALYFGVR